MTNLDVSGFDTSEATNLGAMFWDCSKLTNLDVGGFDTSNAISLDGMFWDCSNLTNLDVSGFDTSNAISLDSMFLGCSNLTNLDVSGFDTSEATGLGRMFEGCTSLTDLNVSHFDTSKVGTMAGMFRDCSNLKILDLSSFDAGQVSTMYCMFSGCENLTTLKTPYNVKTFGENSCILPGEIWYRSDGTEVTELPKDLSYSVKLGRNYIPEEDIIPDDEPIAYQDYILTVYNEETKSPVPDVKVALNDRCYTTGSDGKIKVTLPEEQKQCYSVSLTKKGFETKKQNITLDASKSTDIFLKPTLDFKINLPGIKTEVPIQNKINIGGKDITWLDMKFDISMDFSNPKSEISQKFPIKATFDTEKKTVKVTFGIEEKDEDGVVNTESYNKMKNLCKWVENRDGSQKIQNFMDKNGWKMDGEMGGVSIKTSIMGYLEYSLETGELLESGAVIGMKGSGSVTYRPASTLGILYAKATLSLSAEGTLLVSFENEDISFSAELELAQALGIAGGVGGKKVGAEIGAEGSLKEKLEIPFRNAESSLKISTSAKVYAEVRFGITIKRNFPLYDISLWPWGASSQSLQGNSETIDLNSLELAQRDYVITNSTRSRAVGIEAEDTYPDGTPQMVKLSDGTLLAVWVTDLGTKSSENRTTLVYSAQKKGRWSAPKAVCETGRADFYPDLTAKGDKAYLIWTNVDHELSEDFTVEEMVNSTDLYYAVYEDGAFGEPERITETGNKKTELYGTVISDGTKQTVIWLENSENDPFLYTGKNSVYAKTCENGTWGKAKCLLQNLNPISGLDAEYVNGRLNLAYTMDLDGDLDTSKDVEVFLYQDGDVQRITSDSRDDENVYFGTDKLYWSADGEIMQAVPGEKETVSTTGITGADGFEVLENSNEKAVLVLRAEGFQSSLYLSEQTADGYSAPIPVTDNGKKIRGYAAVYQDNGVLNAITFEAEVLDDIEDAESPYGATDLCVYDQMEASNLTLTDVYVDTEKLIPWETIPVELTLYNGSSTELTGVRVTMKAGTADSKIETVACQIAPGATGIVSADYVIGSLAEEPELSVEVLPTNYEDDTPSDNTKSLKLINGEVELKNVKTNMRSNGTANISGQLTHQNGYSTAKNGMLCVRYGGEEGEEIYNDSKSDMNGDSGSFFEIPIPEKYLDFANENDGKYFYVSYSSDTEEGRYDNNNTVVVLFPTAVSGVELQEETLELPVKSQRSIHASVLPENALNQNIYYTTSDSSVAAVDETGTITAVSEGTAVISAITADGGYAKSCTVTVTAAEEGTVVYSLNRKSLSMEKGKEATLSVKGSDGSMPTQEVRWISSDETVATVDQQGTVKAQTAGTACITVQVGENSYDSCMVAVEDKELQAILFEKDKLELTEGETEKLSVSLIPEETSTDKTLRWSSSDNTVAAVDENGVVTAVSGGSATITAVSVNGIEESCQVQVNALPRYTVIFDSDLGDEPQTVTGILEGQKAKLPAHPVRTGYKFGGWYTEKSGQGTVFNENTPVEGNLTVYAYWTENPSYEGYTVEEIAAQTYTGSAIKPQPIVMDRGNFLIMNKDYTVTYKNNVKVGTAQILIKGKGNYTKNITVEFQIVPKSLEEEGIKVTVADQKYGKTGSKITPKVTVADGKKTLKVGTDYQITVKKSTFDESMKGADIPIIITGKGNYEGSLMKNFHIFDIAVSSFVVEPIERQIYTGSALMPELKVYASKQAQKNGEMLEVGKDYTVSYANNVKTGTGKAIITGLGRYGGNKTVTFVIQKKSLKADQKDIQVVLEEESLVYTGSTIKPKVLVLYGENELMQGTDYTVKYVNNINVASIDSKKAPMVTITGKGNYEGNQTLKFAIKAKQLDKSDDIMVTVTEAKVNGKKAVKPVVTVKDGNRILKNNTHYTLTYENNVGVGEPGTDEAPTVRIEGKGNYSGELIREFRIYETEVTSFVTEPIAKQEYAEEEIEPEVVVYESAKARKDGEVLIEGKDYELSYENNIKVGTGRVIISGIGKYGGTKKVSFTIQKKTLKNEDVQIGLLNPEQVFTYSGEGIKPEIFVKWKKGELKEGTDYTVKYLNNINAASETSKIAPTIIITGKGDFTESRVLKFSIEPKQLKESDNITISVTEVKANGKKTVKPIVIVKDGSKILKNATHYTLTYENNVGVGEPGTDEAPTVRIEGKGNYSGELSREFRIYETRTTSFVTDPIAKQEYTGDEIKPEVVVYESAKARKNGETLVEGEDYELSYENNIQIGTGRVVISGIGKYGGIKKISFTIQKKTLQDENMQVKLQDSEQVFVYSGTGIKPVVLVTWKKKELKEGTDYTVKYSNNVNAASETSKMAPTITVIGKGNFAGSRTLKFAIVPKDLTENITITVAEIKENGKKAVMPAVTAKDGRITLRKNIDYTLVYKNNIGAEELDSKNAPTVTVIGRGNYTGTLMQNFRIYKKSIGSVIVENVPNQSYTGNSITPKVTVYASRYEQKKQNPLVEGIDYEIEYPEYGNVKVGTGTLDIHGIGEYGGIRKAKFLILPRWLQRCTKGT